MNSTCKYAWNCEDGATVDRELLDMVAGNLVSSGSTSAFSCETISGY